MPLVSVIIPTYGHRDYVLATLESVFAQTFADYEIIVINDGSPDDTAAVLRPLVDEAKIRYVEQPNAGQSAARNRGLEMAVGEFVAYLDDDDLWPPDKLAWQVAVLRQNPDAVAVGGNCAILKDGRLDVVVEPTRKPRLLPVDFFTNNAFYSPGQVLIRRSALTAIGGFDPAIWGSDDLDLWMRLAAAGTFVYESRVALHYRMHASNASRHWERMLVNNRRVFRKNIGLVPENQRAAAAATGEKFNYMYAGSAQVQSVWSIKPARWRAAAKVFGYFIGPALRQPGLALAMARDCVPRAVRRVLKPKH